MPRIPYEPYSTAQPDPSGERVNVNAPPAAFGVNVGAAIEHLGTTTDQVGNEMFTRAIALQELQNQNSARAAQSDYVLKSGEADAQFGALTGKAQVDALPAYLANQRKLREDIRDKIQSPMARQYYDADSLPFMQRNVFSAVHRAADSNKQFTFDTGENSIKTDIGIAAQNSDDMGYTSQLREKIRTDATNNAFLKFGVSDPKDPNVVQYVNDWLSKQRAEQILGVAIHDPIAAGQMAETYKGDLTNPQDLQRVNSAIENKSATVAGTSIVNGIINKHLQSDGSYDATQAQMQQEARDAAVRELPKNSLLPTTAERILDGRLYMARLGVKQDTADAVHTFDSLITDNNVHDAQTFLTLPNAESLIQRLPPQYRTADGIQAEINNFNRARDRITDQDMMTTINGMRTESTDGGAAFMAINPRDPKWHLSQDHIRQVQDQQYKMAMHPESDPRVENAMRALTGARGAELNALGVDKLDKNNPDDYYHFRGTLQEALQVWQEDHNGKQPSTEEIIDKIGPQIIKTQTSKPGFFNIFGVGTTNQEPAFREFNRPSIEDVPENFRQQVTSEVLKKGGVAPSEAQITQVWARVQFNKYYKQAKPSE